MIYLCDFVPETFKTGDYDNVEEVEWDDESAFVFVTMKIQRIILFNAQLDLY